MTDFTKPSTCKCYGMQTAKGTCVPFEITRRAAHPNDVVIAVKFAGICHSDIHQVEEDWGPGIFPMVPGHEISGEVVFVGSKVTKFAVGDHAGVGCMVDSCRNCSSCSRGEEQYCVTGSVFTYNGKHKYQHCVEYTPEGGTPTYGGYSKTIIVDQSFVLKIPSNLDLAGAAPLLCAGITTYSPLIHFGLRPFHKFAVAGLGGLGHMAVKFGKGFGAHVTVISRGIKKKEDALTNLKADAYLDATDADAMTAAMGSFDFILDTISAQHDINAYLGLVKVDGKVVLVGAPNTPLPVYAAGLFFQRKTLAGSLIGGIKETQDMLDFCGRHNILCDVEVIPATKIDEAYVRTKNADVKYRFVIDTSTI